MKKQFVAVVIVIVCVVGWYKISLGPIVEVGKEEVKGEEKSSEQKAADEYLQTQVEQELATRKAEPGKEEKIPEQPTITIERASANLTAAFSSGDQGAITRAQTEVDTAVDETPKQQLLEEQKRLNEELKKTGGELAKTLEVAGSEPAPKVGTPEFIDLLNTSLQKITGLDANSLSEVLKLQTNLNEYLSTVDRATLRKDLSTQVSDQDKVNYLTETRAEIQKLYDALDAKLKDSAISAGEDRYSVRATLENLRTGLGNALGTVDVETANVGVTRFKSLSNSLRSFGNKIKSFLGIGTDPQADIQSALSTLGVNDGLATAQSAADVANRLSIAIDTLSSDVAVKQIQATTIESIQQDIGFQDVAAIPDAAANLQQEIEGMQQSRVVLKTQEGLFVEVKVDSAGKVILDEQGQVVPVEGAKQYGTFFEYRWDTYIADLKTGQGGIKVNEVYKSVFTNDVKSTVINIPTDLTKVNENQIEAAYNEWSQRPNFATDPQYESIRAAFDIIRNPVNRVVYDSFLADYTALAPGGPRPLDAFYITGRETQAGFSQSPQVARNYLATKGELAKWAITNSADIAALNGAQEQATQLSEKTANMQTKLASANTSIDKMLQQAKQETTGQFGGF